MTGPFTLTFDPSPASADMDQLDAALGRYNAPFTGAVGYQLVGLYLRNPEGELMGGAAGYVGHGWVNVATLWVHESLRGSGWGRRLLLRLEEEARHLGARGAFLFTYSFQAPGFYRKQGYETFGILDDFPPGHQRHFMRKSLGTP